MFQAVIAFARNGNPNHEGLPQWNACTPDHEVTMVFDRTCYTGENFDDEVLRLLKEVLPAFSFETLMSSMDTQIQH